MSVGDGKCFSNISRSLVINLIIEKCRGTKRAAKGLYFLHDLIVVVQIIFTHVVPIHQVDDSLLSGTDDKMWVQGATH